jgi:DNA-binding HxlR family transcriptional regulator
MYPWPAGYLAENLKALGDESRLAIVRLLHGQERNVGELAEMLQLSEPTVSHHLAKLRELQLLTLRMAGNQRFYSLNESRLAQFKAQVQQIEKTPEKPADDSPDNGWIDALGWPQAESDVLRKVMRGQRISRLPTKQKELLVVLRWLATRFERGTRYSEKDVNAIIKAHHDDYVSLRRDLVDVGYLRREIGGGRYWLAEEE